MAKIGRPKKNKTPVCIKLDNELNDILNKKQINKSEFINSLLYKYLTLEKNNSLLTSPQSLVSNETSCTGFEPAAFRLRAGRERSIETRDKGLKQKSDLFRIYESSLNELEQWLYSKYSQRYSSDVLHYLKTIFQNKNLELKHISQSFEDMQGSYKGLRIAFRVFLNYCELNDLIDFNLILKLRAKVKLNVKSGIDTFVPTKTQIKQSLEIIKQIYPKEFLILYKVMLESGIRFTELKYIIKSFNKQNIEILQEKIVAYSNFYIRGKKASYFVFMTIKTYNKLLDTLKFIDTNMLNSFQNRTSKNKDIVCLKYIRKYHFTLMIESNISLEIANFIQGRTSQNIGFNHYLHKKNIAVKEYLKIVKNFD